MSGPNTAFIAQWRRTPSLRAVRELIQVAEQVAPAVARRADRHAGVAGAADAHRLPPRPGRAGQGGPG